LYWICKKKTYLFKNKKLYVEFYDGDYLTFFERNHKKEKHFGKCKTGYKICGILDIFNNTLCVKDDEDCPINDINIEYNRFSNDKTENRIINQLYISENSNATIFDINKIYTKLDIYEEKKNK
jgi:hypothetical protein